MISKDELLAALRRSLSEEEFAIELYEQNKKDSFLTENLPEEVKEKIKTLFESFSKNSQEHRDAYNQLIEKIEETEQDVF